MKKQIWGITGGFLLILVIATILFIWVSNPNRINENKRQQLVLLNEISNEIDQFIDESEKKDETTDESEKKDKTIDESASSINMKFADQIADLDYMIRYDVNNSTVTDYRFWILILFGIMVLYTFMIMGYVYNKIIRPFDKMRDYAEQVAGGNFDIQLTYERKNFFGPFTWAFDHMRGEILFARKKEAEAITENKAIIATLSHDIKTPIASIRAYSELLEANLNSDYEKRQEYSAVIMRKCDEVTKLVNDLVIHSLSELEKLQINCEEIEISNALQKIVKDFEYPEIFLEDQIPRATIQGDEKRIAQVIENLLNNARKYAPDTEVKIYAKINREEHQYQIHVKDHGEGILPEDMPFITNRFYRGKNIGSQPGSGLGLYIVKYIMEAMKGGIILTNEADGLDACIWFPMRFT